MLPALTPAERRREPLSDENLVALAQRYPRRRKVAVHILALRHFERLQLLITGLGREQKLGAQDIEDACQQIYIWTGEALVRYDPEHKPRAQFRTFLGLVVTSRFHSFVSTLLRRRRRQRHLAELLERAEAELPLPDWARSANLVTAPESEPVELAARREDRTRVRKALGRLEPIERWICRQFQMGTSIRELAGILHVSRRKAARMVAEVFAKLRRLLREGG